MNDKNRQDEFDIARGIAMTAVCFSHNGGIPLISRFVTSFFIALFFVISGYFYKPEKVRKRIINLCGEYVKYTFILLLFSFLISPDNFSLAKLGGGHCILAICFIQTLAAGIFIFSLWITIRCGFLRH